MKISMKKLLPTWVWPDNRAMRVKKARKIFNAIDFQPGDIAVDCGANVGKIAQKLERRGAIVHAFEPNPYAFDELTSRFAGSTKVHCYNKAVLDRSGSLKLYCHHRSDEDEVQFSQGSSLVKDKPNVREDKYFEVEVIDLSEFLGQINSRIRLLKLDVEGVECEIVTKLIELNIVDNIDFIFVETHERKIPQLKKPVKELKRLISRRRKNNINLDWR